MTIKSKIATAVAIATLAGSLAIPTSAAQARGGWGLGAAVLGTAIVGATVAALRMLKTPEAVAAQRGLTVEQVTPAALLRARAEVPE